MQVISKQVNYQQIAYMYAMCNHSNMAMGETKRTRGCNVNIGIS